MKAFSNYYSSNFSLAGSLIPTPSLFAPENLSYSTLKGTESKEQYADFCKSVLNLGLLDNSAFRVHGTPMIYGYRGTHVMARIKGCETEMWLNLAPATRYITVSESATSPGNIQDSPMDGSVGAAFKNTGIMADAMRPALSPIAAGVTPELRESFVKEGKHVEGLVARLAAFALEHAIVPFRTRVRPVSPYACYVYTSMRAGRAVGGRSIYDSSDLEAFMGVRGGERARRNINVLYVGDAQNKRGMALLSCIGRPGGPMHNSKHALLEQFTDELKVLMVGEVAMHDEFPQVQHEHLWSAIQEAEYILTTYNGVPKKMFSFYVSLFAGNLAIMNRSAIMEMPNGGDLIYNATTAGNGLRPPSNTAGLDDALDQAIGDAFYEPGEQRTFLPAVERSIFSQTFRRVEQTFGLVEAPLASAPYRVGLRAANVLQNGMQLLAQPPIDFGPNVYSWSRNFGPRLPAGRAVLDVRPNHLLPVMPLIAGARGFRMFVFLDEQVAIQNNNIVPGLAAAPDGTVRIGQQLRGIHPVRAADANAVPPVLAATWYEITGPEFIINMDVYVIDYTAPSLPLFNAGAQDVFNIRAYHPAQENLINARQYTPVAYNILCSQPVVNDFRASGEQEIEDVINDSSLCPGVGGRMTDAWHLSINPIWILSRWWLCRNIADEQGLITQRTMNRAGRNIDLFGLRDSFLLFCGGMRRYREIVVPGGLWALNFIPAVREVHPIGNEILIKLRSEPDLAQGLLKVRASTEAAQLVLRISPACIDGTPALDQALGPLRDTLARVQKSVVRNYTPDVLDAHIKALLYNVYDSRHMHELALYDTRVTSELYVKPWQRLTPVARKYLCYSIPTVLDRQGLLALVGGALPNLKVNSEGADLLNSMEWVGKFTLDDADVAFPAATLDSAEGELFLARAASLYGTAFGVSHWACAALSRGITVDLSDYVPTLRNRFGLNVLRWAFPFIARPDRIVGAKNDRTIQHFRNLTPDQIRQDWNVNRPPLINVNLYQAFFDSDVQHDMVDRRVRPTWNEDSFQGTIYYHGDRIKDILPEVKGGHLGGGVFMSSGLRNLMTLVTNVPVVDSKGQVDVKTHGTSQSVSVAPNIIQTPNLAAPEVSDNSDLIAKLLQAAQTMSVEQKKMLGAALGFSEQKDFQ